MRIWFDIESNSKSAYSAEPIEMYFLREDGVSYHFKSKIDKWSYEAEEIHGISKAEMLMHPDKKDAFGALISWLPDTFELICFANPQTELGFLLYDVVVFKYSIMNHLNLARDIHLPFEITSSSVHSLAKQCAKECLFDPYRKPETNRVSFTQDNVYLALFGQMPFGSHRAKSDVENMKRIYSRLIELKESGKSIANKQQMELI